MSIIIIILNYEGGLLLECCCSIFVNMALYFECRINKKNALLQTVFWRFSPLDNLLLWFIF